MKFLKSFLACTLFITLSLVTACGFNSTPNYSGIIDNTGYVQPVSTEPAVFEKFAIESNGEIQVNGQLVTEGPLADIFSNDEIKISSRSFISGDVISSKNIPAVNTRLFLGNSASRTEHRRVVVRTVTDFVNENYQLLNAYIFNSDGTVSLLSGGTAAQLSENPFPGTWFFDNNGWKVSGNGETITSNVIVEGSLYITDSLSVRSRLFVKGNLKCDGHLAVDNNDPFNLSLITDGSLIVNNAVVIGKIDAGGNLDVKKSLSVIGSIKVDGSISIDGVARINYLDTIYKSALLNAQNHHGETLLSHSQIFNDLRGKNATALFTFAKGYRMLTEENILFNIKNNDIVPEDFYTIIMGASIKYGTDIAYYETIAPYYKNKAALFNKLESNGYKNIEIAEALFVPFTDYYLTLRERGGEIIGTYLVMSDTKQFDLENLVILTAEKRQELIAELEKNESGQDETDVAARSAEETVTNETETVSEWKYSKEAVEEKRIITVETEELVNDDESGDGRNLRGWKKIKKIVKVAVTIIAPPLPPIISPGTIINTGIDAINYISNLNKVDINKRFIAGVDETANDLWSKQISVVNDNYGYCTPISALMILRYYGQQKGYHKLFAPGLSSRDTLFRSCLTNQTVRDIRIGDKTLESCQRYGDHLYGMISLHLLLASEMNTGIDGSTKNDKAASAINRILNSFGIPGKSEFHERLYCWLYDEFKERVNDNRPSILHSGEHGGWNSEHSTVVIGYRHETTHPLNFWKWNKRFLYLHSTWGLADKSWYRFDKIEHPRSCWNGTIVRVD